MGMAKKIWLVALAVLSVIAPQTAGAVPITIINPGFEDPATTTTSPFTGTDWTVFSGTGGAGVWNINSFATTYWNAAPGTAAPEGNQIGFISLGPAPGSSVTISQILGVPVFADTTYTLSGYVGDPLGLPAIFTAALYAGGHLLAATGGSAPLGDFALFQVSYDSSIGTSYVGQMLEIRLSSNEAQTGFDAIALDAVPEPATLLLLGSGLVGLGSVAWRRRRA